MDESQVVGGAGPALAAHSKDASAHGATQASRATGNDVRTSSSVSDDGTRISGEVREAAGQVGSSALDPARSARKSLSEPGGHAAERAVEFVREQPFVALAVTGAACLALGILLGRR